MMSPNLKTFCTFIHDLRNSNFWLVGSTYSADDRAWSVTAERKKTRVRFSWCGEQMTLQQEAAPAPHPETVWTAGKKTRLSNVEELPLVLKNAIIGHEQSLST